MVNRLGTDLALSLSGFTVNTAPTNADGFTRIRAGGIASLLVYSPDGGTTKICHLTGAGAPDMNLSYFPAGTLESHAALRVLGPDNPGRLTVGRAGSATTLTATSSVATATANLPRFSGAARRLLVEGRRSNQIRNARGEGAVPGPYSSGGALPGFWGLNGVTPALLEILGTGEEDGLSYTDIRAAGSSTFALRFGAPTEAAAAAGQSIASAVHARLLAGALSDSALLEVDFFANNATSINKIAIAPTGARLASQRFTNVYVFPSAVSIVSRLRFSGSYDVSLRIAAPTLEPDAAFPSSVILPPAGAPAVSTREADQPAWAPAGGFGAQGTLVVRAMLPQLAPFGASQGLWQIDDGTDQNRVALRNTSAGSAITGVVDLGGTNLATLSPAT
ncbi:hypothetical protein ACFQU7_10685 [Pseudoroseomonas wenyumeiae]